MILSRHTPELDMSQPIKFFSTEAQDNQVDLLGAISRVVGRKHYVLGEEVNRFQEAFASYIGTAFCVGVGNGSDALELALRALGIARDDEVACVANAGFYAPTAIYAVGAKPVYIDIAPDTMTMSSDSLVSQLQGRQVKAVIVTHLYGQCADVPKLLAACTARGIPLIEDCAQAHGAMINGRRAGSFGAMGCFSFYPTKNLGAIGDGGALVTSDPVLHDHIQKLRQYGWDKKYHVGLAGGRNSRLDEVQAAVLRDKLAWLDRWNEQRRDTARRYSQALSALPLRLPTSLADDYVAHLYVVRTPHRDPLKAHLASLGVSTDIHYPIPCHLQPAYRDDQANGPLDQCVEACNQVLTLPCYPGMPASDTDRVIAAVQQFFEGHAR